MLLALFRFLLQLYPSRVRQQFGDSMTDLFRERLDSARGRVGRFRVFVEAAWDVVFDAFAARLEPDSAHASRNRAWKSNYGSKLGIMFANLKQDLAYAVRTLRKAPSFTAVAVATLALGIGANSSVFSIVRTVLLKPLPYAEQARIVSVWNATNTTDLTDYAQPTWLSEPEVIDYRGAPALDELAVYTYNDAVLTGDQGPERVTAGEVEAGLLRVFGVQPELGRWFADEENAPGAATSVLLGHRLWVTRYGRDPSIVGTEIVVDGRPRTVIGVMPPDFRLPLDFGGKLGVQLYLPIELDRADPSSRGSHYLFGVARLANGATVEQASLQLESITDRLTEEGHYSPERGFRAFALPIRKQIVGNIEPAMLILLGAVGFVLLIACTNVANLLLARAQSRSRELAVRSALGASARRLIAQQMVESTVLVLSAGVLGVLVAVVGLRAVVSLDVQTIPRAAAVSIDGPVLLFSAVISIATGLFFGLIPALRASRSDPEAGMREGSRGGGFGRGTERMRRTLVVTQVAFAVLLATGGTLMVRSFWNLLRIDTGFDTTEVMTAQLYLPRADYDTDEGVTGFYRALLDRLTQIPGIEAIGLARNIPLNEEIGTWSVTAENKPRTDDGSFQGDWQIVSEGYAQAMGMRLISGRLIESTDREGQIPVAVVNERFAEVIWPGEAPVGKRFKLGGEDSDRRWITVVGMTANVRHNDLRKVADPKFYIPFEQWPEDANSSARRSMHVVTKAANPLSVVSRLREVVDEMDPNLPLAQVQTYDDIRARVMSDSRLVMALLTGFAALALLLAAVGVYGVVSYSVAQRVPEIGVRMALGATGAHVVRMVLNQGLILVGGGVLAGVVAAAVTGRFLASMLYEVSDMDPLSYAIVPVTLFVVAVVASLLPAARAARVDPMRALRCE